jgi:hypothetical protein
MTPALHNIRVLPPGIIAPDSLYATKPMTWFVGRSVKKAFPTNDRQCTDEHMWVAITHYDGDKLFGWLDSDPVIVEDMNYGDPVTLTRESIEAVTLSREEWQEELHQLWSTPDDTIEYPDDIDGVQEAYDHGWTPRQALRWWKDIKAHAEHDKRHARDEGLLTRQR